MVLPVLHLLESRTTVPGHVGRASHYTDQIAEKAGQVRVILDNQHTQTGFK